VLFERLTPVILKMCNVSRKMLVQFSRLCC
jgi:hypothetical protein